MNPSSSGAGPGSPQFPMPPAAFDGTSRKVEAGACFDWLRQGWALFVGNPGVWIACALLILVALFALSMVHMVGSLVVLLLSPVLGAGLFHLCRRQSEGVAPTVADLFIGFKERTSDLILVGVAFAVAMLAIGALVGLVVGGGMLGGAAAGMMGGGHMVGFGLMLVGMLVGLLLVTVLSVPVSMAVWFAPALVFCNGMQPLPAMKASFHACLKNWLAFGVYGVILFVLVSLAAPTLLGLLVLIPVLAGAQYASYRDIFVGV